MQWKGEGGGRRLKTWLFTTKVGGRNWKRTCAGPWRASGTFVSVVGCAYAPNATPPRVKVKLYVDLQDAVVGFHADILLISVLLSLGCRLEE